MTTEEMIEQEFQKWEYGHSHYQSQVAFTEGFRACLAMLEPVKELRYFDVGADLQLLNFYRLPEGVKP